MGLSSKTAFISECMQQRCCQHPDCPDPPAIDWDPHHVVYQQHIDEEMCKWDTDDALRICSRCHERHHKGFNRIPLSALRDENIEFAVRVLGSSGRAYNYLNRRYRGQDPRVEALLEAA